MTTEAGKALLMRLYRTEPKTMAELGTEYAAGRRRLSGDIAAIEAEAIERAIARIEMVLSGLPTWVISDPGLPISFTDDDGLIHRGNLDGQRVTTVGLHAVLAALRERTP